MHPLDLPRTYATLPWASLVGECYRTERKRMQALSGGYRHILGVYLAPQRVRLTILATLLLIDLVLHLGLPRVVQTFIDSAIAGGALRTLSWIGIAYLA